MTGSLWKQLGVWSAGVFAAGGVVSKLFIQITVATAEGFIAAIQAPRELEWSPHRSL